MNAEELDLLLQARAQAMQDYLNGLGAVRSDEGHQPGIDFPCATRPEIERVIDIPSAMFPAVKRKAMDLGIPICIKSGVGHYLSTDLAEVVTNPDFMTKQISSSLESLHDYTMSAGRVTTWEMLNQFQRRHLGSNLVRTVRLLRNTGFALPAAAEKLILALSDGRSN